MKIAVHACQMILYVKLNKEKVKFKGKEVPFIGHVLTDGGLKPDPGKIKAILEMPQPTECCWSAPTGGVRELP